MAQLNITLNQDGILPLLANDIDSFILLHQKKRNESDLH